MAAARPVKPAPTLKGRSLHPDVPPPHVGPATTQLHSLKASRSDAVPFLLQNLRSSPFVGGFEVAGLLPDECPGKLYIATSRPELSRSK